MTHTILKSTLAPPPVSFEEASAAFGRLVDAHLHELRTWHDHDIQVRTQQPLRRQPKPEDHAAAEEYWRAQASWHNERRARFEPYPPPIAHPDIVASVASVVGADGTITYAADFEVINDDPTEEQILHRKKAALLQAVLEAEAEALADVQLPAGKQRAAQLLENDIRVKDAELAKELAAHAKASAGKNIDIATDVAAEIEKLRDPKHTRHLADQASRRAKVDAIVRAAAQVMSDIEDMTADSIDSFVLPIRLVLKEETVTRRSK